MLREEGKDRKRDLGIDIKEQPGDLLQLGCLHQGGDIEGENLQNKTSFNDLFGKFKDVSVETARQPFVICSVIGFNIEPEGVYTCFFEDIEILRGKPITIGLDQYPEAGLRFNQPCTFDIKFRTTGEVSSGKSHNIPRRPPSLRTQDNILFLDNPGTERGSFSIHDTGTATATGLMGMKGGGPLPGFPNRHPLFILFTSLQHIGRRPPFPFGFFGESPGMAFPAGEVTS
jgi:hypothetical protein